MKSSIKLILFPRGVFASIPEFDFLSLYLIQSMKVSFSSLSSISFSVDVNLSVLISNLKLSINSFKIFLSLVKRAVLLKTFS